MFKRKIVTEIEAWKNNTGKKKVLVIKGLRNCVRETPSALALGSSHEITVLVGSVFAYVYLYATRKNIEI